MLQSSQNTSSPAPNYNNESIPPSSTGSSYSERAITDLRGERVRVYNNKILKQQVKENFSNVLDWTPNGLPKSYLPLFAPGRTAFVSKGEKIVGHGGISVEELIVPLIQIQRSSS